MKQTHFWTAKQNEELGIGPQLLFHAYFTKDGIPLVPALLNQVEKNVIKVRKGGSVLISDIPKDLQPYFAGIDNFGTAFWMAVQDLMSAERLHLRYCGTTFGENEYSPRELGELFLQEIETLVTVFEDFNRKYDIDSMNGLFAARLFTGVCALNDFNVTIEAFVRGVAVILYQKIDDEIYPVSYEVVSQDIR